MKIKLVLYKKTNSCSIGQTRLGNKVFIWRKVDLEQTWESLQYLFSLNETKLKRTICYYEFGVSGFESVFLYSIVPPFHCLTFLWRRVTFTNWKIWADKTKNTIAYNKMGPVFEFTRVKHLIGRQPNGWLQWNENKINCTCIVRTP